VAASAQKRHGRIIELALMASISETGKFHVWRERDFRVSAAADRLIVSQSEADCRASQLPYDGRGRALQIDMMVYDPAARTLGAYEIKRGNGYHDAGKQRSIRRDLLCTSLLLQSFAERRGLHVGGGCWARIIFYYNVRSIEAPWSICGYEIDRHFRASILPRVEQANDLFQARLFDLLDLANDRRDDPEQLPLFQGELVA
jgi:hypothetical protein